jgi:hypothetical protein
MFASASETIIDEYQSTLSRLKNWSNWQACLASVGVGLPGRAAFYKIPGGIDLTYDMDDAELVESALSIFVRSWGRKQFQKIKNYLSATSTTELAERSGMTRYLYETEIKGLLHKVQYCIEYVEDSARKSS